MAAFEVTTEADVSDKPWPYFFRSGLGLAVTLKLKFFCPSLFAGLITKPYRCPLCPLAHR